MALTELIFDIEKVDIGLITLDASVRELHRASAQLTRHPIEPEEAATPGEISDHVIVDPLTVQIEGVVSNHPVEFLAGVFQDVDDPAQQAFLELSADVLLGSVITIKTTLHEYEDMVLESIDVTRDAAKGNALYFTASARQISLVSSETTTAETKPPAASTKNAGKKGTDPASSADANASGSFWGNITPAYP